MHDELMREAVLAILWRVHAGQDTPGDALDAAIAALWQMFRERHIAAVRSERLEEPQLGTSDEAYMQALDDAEAAIRALTMENDRG
jgi:hypothetical protein